MNIEEYRDFCLTVRGAAESMPFDESTLVYKVMGKMFTYASIVPHEGRYEGQLLANMKCDPERSAELMERYEGIFWGPYSDKKYWITVSLESDVPDGLIRELIRHAVDEVIRKLPKKRQKEYYADETEEACKGPVS